MIRRQLWLLGPALGCGGEPSPTPAAADARLAALEARVDALEQARDAATVRESIAPTPAPAPAPLEPLALPPTPAAPSLLSTIAIDRDGLALDGKPVTLDELEAELRTRAPKHGSLRVTIEADDDVRYDEVVRVMDRVRGVSDRIAIVGRGGTLAPDRDGRSTAR